MSSNTKAFEEKMKSSVEHLNRELAAVRAGRANPAVLDKVSVDYYGAPTPIQQVASVAVSEARTLTITPWDRSLLRAISKAIMASDVGITPIDDGQTIRLNFPAPNEERRKQLAKEVSKLGEEAKVAVRNIRIKFLGDRAALDPKLQKLMNELEEDSAHKTGMTLNIAVNYGGRPEIVRAARQLAEKVKAGELQPEDITEEMMSDAMYTTGQKDPDFILRPSGEKRLSNFMLWQAAYSELVEMDVLWPDFTRDDLDAAITEFNKRSRRFGGI